MQNENAVQNHMEVIGADGQHVGTVDHVQSDHTIKLTKNDAAAGGHHHSIPMDWVSDVEGDRVRLSMPSAEAKRQWTEL
ncbi:MAG TPA: DUF2171 domain-containing protein [Longimicrobiaceae bacterium]|nr:DUF2171 domain-containing protein [Longimicrobiaceae bacterium]